MGDNDMKFKIAAVIAIAVLAFATQTQAHHSSAMFDQEKLITVSGTLKQFEWTNPHCWLHVQAADPSTGKMVDWSFEMGSVSQISPQGWKVDSVKAGDKITIPRRTIPVGEAERRPGISVDSRSKQPECREIKQETECRLKFPGSSSRSNNITAWAKPELSPRMSGWSLLTARSSE